MELDDIITELSSMPRETLVYKTIKGKRQPYLQWTESGRTKSRYVKCAEREVLLPVFAKKEELKRLYREKLEEITWSGNYGDYVAEQIAYGKSEHEQLITRKTEHGTFAVERDYVNSRQYHDKFLNLPVSHDVQERVYKEMGRLLEYVDGRDEERMTVVSARTGEHIVDNFKRTGYTDHTSFTDNEYSKIKAYPGFVILIHNHPYNGRPSARDIISYAGDEHVKMSIVACHDGTLYAVFAARPNVKDIYEELLAFEKERFRDQEYAKYLATTRLYQLNDGLGARHKLFDLRRF